MKTIKTVLALLAAATLVFASGCGTSTGNGTDDDNSAVTTVAEATDGTEESQPAETNDEEQDDVGGEGLSETLSNELAPTETTAAAE